MDFIITFRTDLFIKVYQRIQSADYTVISILPSANPLNAWEGFSVIGGNGHVYEMFGNSKHYFVQDRKSTRLNSSHVRISYAVFCLKKKKKNNKYHNL